HEDARTKRIDGGEGGADTGPLQRRELRGRRLVVHVPADRQQPERDQAEWKRTVRVDPHPHRRDQPSWVDPALGREEHKAERDQKFLSMLMIAGPSTITNSAGKMQNTIGISILTGAFCARSWAS